ncbi:Mpv17 / PMP22 family protein [Oesophagostomum dentatum]|uniref:Mitochondrial inner membrane protein Mpv17 n=1 Tax=Oesophagostomum dentatum TaxID=61180 RepID=A0A0B1T7P4_OESDE|nr:Mpv17 / PMP22 family protein [Oesophagostomum dentatum]
MKYKELTVRQYFTLVQAEGVICGAGDAFTQIAFEKRRLKDYDFERTGRFVVLASVFIAPPLNRWFRLLERIRGNPKIVPAFRVAIDQLAFAPFFNGVILVTLRLLERLSFDTSWRKMKEDWWPIYSSSLMVWPAVQLVNFYLIPLNMRVIIVQMVAFFWNAYLSYRTQTLSESEFMY